MSARVSDSVAQGVLLTMLGVLCFTGIDTCAKWLAEAGMPPMQVAFIRYAAHIGLMSAVLLPMRGRAMLRSKNWKLELLRGVCLLGATLSNFTALRYLDLTLATTIAFTAPLWICVFSVLFLGEKVGAYRWAAIAVGFVGVAIAMRPWSADAHWAVFFSLATALFHAVYMICARLLAGVDSADTQQYYTALLATLALSPMALDFSLPSNFSGADWTALALIGVFGWAGHQALTIAHKFASAAILAPFIYSQFVFVTISSWLVFHKAPDRLVMLGGLIVVASGLFIWFRERRLSQT